MQIKISTLFVSVALGLCGFVARAQRNFRPGYIVQPAGDTVRGLVDYRTARRNGSLCQFRVAPNATTQVLRPSELRGYGVAGGAVYQAARVPLPDSAGQRRPARWFFLETLVAGPPAALCVQHVGFGEVRFFVQKGVGAPLAELTEQHQSVLDGQRQYAQTIPLFRGVLSEQFADCPGLSLGLAKVEFKPKALIAAVQRYNACRQPGIRQAQVYKSPAHLSFDVLLGVQTSQLTFSGFISPINGNFRANLAPEIGAGLSLSSRTARDKFALRLEAHYARQYYEDQYTFKSATGNSSTFLSPDTYQSRFQASYLRIPLVVRYLPFAGRVRPFLEVGASVSPLLQLTQESRAYGTSTSTYGPWQPTYDPADVRHMEYGMLAGVGAQLAGVASHPISVLGRVEKSNGFLDTAINYNKVVRYHLLVSIGLTKQHAESK